MARFSWTDLFETQGRADFTLAVRVLKKSGQDFLVLPGSPGMAAKALSLYPAQKQVSKFAKTALGVALRLNLPVGLKRASVSLSRTDPFPQFLISVAGNQAAPFPCLAILAGNPRVEGRRFIVLLFDERGQPVFVVKAGIGEAARRLIQKEASFLRSVSAGISGLPKMRASHASERVEAFALAQVEGESPGGEDWRDAAKLLSGWLDFGKRIALEEVSAWQTLKSGHSSDPLFRRLSELLAGGEFYPALFHGDFAPWNIKVSRQDGLWTALDWERGELLGFPGWDWFHYVIQTGILVKKLSPEQLMKRMEDLFGTPCFHDYARMACISGREKVLATGYLLYCVKILRPTEGRETAESLLTLMSERWLA